MNRRQKIIVSVTGIFLVLLILVGLTYAFFVTRIRGNNNPTSISVTTANLELVYGDNSAEILTGSGALMPTVETDADDAIGTKTFTVTNNGNDSSYVVIIDNVETKYATNGSYKDENGNTITYTKDQETDFVTNDFRYTLTCSVKDKSGNIKNSEKCNDVNSLSIFPIEGGILVGNAIPEDRVHEYTLTLWYIDNGQNQSDDMGKSLQARVNIADVNQMENPFKTGVTATDNASLAYNIINNAKENKNGTELLNSTLTKVAEEKSYTKDTGKMVEQELDLSTQSEWYYGSTYNDAQPWNGGSGYDSVSTCSNTIVNKYISYPTVGESWYVKSCKSETVAIVEAEEMEYESSMQTAQDDYGTSYYYRGNVEDNYVTFADMCWRIVRIDGNGNTKLILEDQDEVCSTTMNGNWDIEASDGTSITMNGSDPYRTGNFGYDDSTGKYKMSYLNPVDNPNRAMVNAFKYFQTKTLTDKISEIYEDKSLSDFLVSGNWCLNNKAYSDSTGTTILENPTYTSTFYYDSYVRLYGKTTKEPTLKCPVETMETFGDNTTPMYVGTLTADEIVYAGGKVYENNPNYYLINNYQKSNSKYFRSLSPYRFDGDFDLAFRVDGSGYLYDLIVHNYNGSFRPSVSLASSAVISSGEGTLESPYVIA